MRVCDVCVTLHKSLRIMHQYGAFDDEDEDCLNYVYITSKFYDGEVHLLRKLREKVTQEKDVA